MNNFRIDITSEGTETLRLALSICLKHQKYVKAYKVDPDRGLCLYWFHQTSDGSAPLLFPHELEDVVTLVQGWLKSQPKEAYTQFIDHDGDMGKGWRLYNESWGHIGGSFYGVCAIQPAWAWYGK